ncbi:MAG: hypothetical protein M1825_004356 [Sarcosagium campestre]|nr:MAG: hypothetical protein M1825_004356 [Sarcosagium campestre]
MVPNSFRLFSTSVITFAVIAIGYAAPVDDNPQHVTLKVRKAIDALNTGEVVSEPWRNPHRGSPNATFELLDSTKHACFISRDDFQCLPSGDFTPTYRFGIDWTEILYLVMPEGANVSMIAPEGWTGEKKGPIVLTKNVTNSEDLKDFNSYSPKEITIDPYPTVRVSLPVDTPTVCSYHLPDYKGTITCYGPGEGNAYVGSAYTFHGNAKMSGIIKTDMSKDGVPFVMKDDVPNLKEWKEYGDNAEFDDYYAKVKVYV